MDGWMEGWMDKYTNELMKKEANKQIKEIQKMLSLKFHFQFMIVEKFKAPESVYSGVLTLHHKVSQ